MLRLRLGPASIEVDPIPAGLATLLILVGVGIMNYLGNRRPPALPPRPDPEPATPPV